MSTEKEWFSRLTFPTNSNAFSQFHPGSNSAVSRSTGTLSRAFNAGSHTPPRKVARLEGDEDCSTTVNRTVEDEEDLYRSTPTKGKGKGKEKDAPRDGVGVPVAQRVVVDRPPEPIPESYYDALLPKILQSIYIALDRPRDDRPKKVMTMSYEDVYQGTMVLVVFAGKGQWLFDKLKFELVEVMNGIVRHLTGEEGSKTSNLDWLASIVEEATWLGVCVEKLEGLLAYLDRVFLVQRRDLQRVKALAMNLFKTRIFEHAEITKRMKSAIGEWAEAERNTSEPHPMRQTIISLLNTLDSYSLFTPLFLTPYLNLTKTYYATESARLAASSNGSTFSPTAFLIHCDTRLKDEQQRSKEVLAEFSWAWSDVEGVVERSLLSERLTLLQDGLKPTLDDRDKDGLKMMYNLFKRVNGLKMLCDTFKAEVQKSAQVVVTDTARDDQMVERLLELKGFLDNAIPYAFSDPAPAPAISPSDASQSKIASTSKSASGTTSSPSTAAGGVVNRDFINASTDAFQHGFKSRRNKPAEMIAKHLDKTMRRGQKTASDEEFGKMLDAALVLYRFTEDRDVFRAFYHRALAKRLLLQRSASDDFEKMVLKKLKEQYDPEFSMGDHMFRDLALSRDILREFHERGIGGSRGEKLSVMVLQRSYWPFTARPKGDILLPIEMQEDLDKYTAFYKEAHKGHKLDFDHSLGTVTMRARFNAGDKELSISLYQAAVLLLFNGGTEIGFKEIKETTRMEDGDLRRTLQSLACAAKKVLRKRPPSRDVNDTDTFRFNAEFTDPQYKVHISSIQLKETPEEAKRTQSSVEDDRKYYLDAAIVRVMKARKTVSHQQLVTAVIGAVKGHFVPEVKMIKTRIEQLIEQEYMKRDEDGESNVYVYVA